MRGRIDRIRDDLEMEGYTEGTPEYEFLLLERRVQLCQEMHRVRVCQACNYVTECPLLRDYLVKLRFNSSDAPPR